MTLEHRGRLLPPTETVAASTSTPRDGDEAVAASGAVGAADSGPPSATVDRPFPFLVRNRETGTVLSLSLGRVLDAAAAQGA